MEGLIVFLFGPKFGVNHCYSTRKTCRETQLPRKYLFFPTYILGTLLNPPWSLCPHQTNGVLNTTSKFSRRCTKYVRSPMDRLELRIFSAGPSPQHCSVSANKIRRSDNDLMAVTLRLWPILNRLQGD